MERKKTKACEDGLYKVVSDNGINMFDGWGTMCEFIKTDKPTNEDVINAIEKSIRDSIEKQAIRLCTSHVNTDARFEASRSLMPSSSLESEVMLKKGTNMRITNYSYTEEDKITFDKEGNKTITPMMVTTITAYSTEKRCTQTYTISHPKETADQYSGFAIAYATMCVGGKKEFNEMANYFMVKLPKIEARHKAELEKKKKELELKNKRLAEKQKKAEIQREARKLKVEYEAAKLAHEKYGVPMPSKFIELETKTIPEVRFTDRFKKSTRMERKEEK